MTLASFGTNPDCEIVTTRTFTASNDVLFSAWSNPEHLKKWWGPNGFTNTFTTFDFREGGTWDFLMHGPEQGHYHNVCEFTKIDPPHGIAWKRHSQPLFNVLFAFEEVDDTHTKVVFTMLFDTAAECAKLRPFVVDKNEENFDRLEALLAELG